MISAARRCDRDTFDRVFDACFDRVFAAALIETGQPRQAGALTRAVLYCAVLQAGDAATDEHPCLLERARSTVRPLEVDGDPGPAPGGPSVLVRRRRST